MMPQKKARKFGESGREKVSKRLGKKEALFNLSTR